MNSQFTLPHIIGLLLKNHFTFELIPGKTTTSYRQHVLIQHPGHPTVYAVFGDEKNGSQLDSAYIDGQLGTKLRVNKQEFIDMLSKPAKDMRWTREMPAADQPNYLPLFVENMDLALVSGHAIILGEVEGGVRAQFESAFPENPFRTMILKTDERPTDFSRSFRGTFHLDGTITDVSFS